MKKKKVFYYTSLSLTIIILLFISISTNRYTEFSTENVVDSIKIFSTDPLNGRLAGSSENDMTTNIIEATFKENKIDKLSNDYLQSFNTVCPSPTNTDPYLKIFSNSKEIASFKYGVDFKEDMINFKNNTFSFSINDKIKALTSYIDVQTKNNHILLYVPENNNFDFRSSFHSEFEYDAVVLITEESKTKILDNIKKGNTVSIHIPFKNEEKEINNIVGVIHGTNPFNSPLIITAHFDHLGTDALGNHYGGALDNASGISFLLELQRHLSSLIKPNRDIIFVALNAEEFGLLGSKYFAENIDFDLEDAEVINFDMVGVEDFPISFTQSKSFENYDSELLNSLEEICLDLDTDFNVRYEDSSDHASFNNLNIDSLTISHSDVSKIHTPDDTVEYISEEAISSVYTVVNKKIINCCYPSFIFIIYSTLFLRFIQLVLLLLIVVPIILKTRAIYLLNKM